MVEAIEKKGSKYAWAVAGSGFFGQMMSLFVLQLWGMTMAYIAADFGVEPTSLAIGASIFGLMYGVLCIVWGTLADRFGLRKVMSIGPVCAGAACIVTGQLAATPTAAIVGYAIAGVFLGAMGTAIVPKIVSTWFSTHSRGKGSALIIVGGSLGGVIFGIVCPIFIKAGGWRGCFTYVGIIVILVGIMLFLVMRDSPAVRGELPYGIEKESEEEIALQNATPVRKKNGFKEAISTLRMANTWKMGIVFICYQAYYTCHTTFFMTALLSTGFDVTKAGLISSMVYVGICIGQIVFPTISDKMARKNLLGTLLLLAGLAYCGLYFVLGSSVSTAAILLYVLMSGIFFACNAMMQVTMSELFPPNMRGTGPGMVNTFGFVGKFFGPIVCSALIAGVWGGNLLCYPLFGGCLAILGGIVALVLLPKTSGKYGDPLAEEYSRKLSEQEKAADEAIAE